MGVGPHCAMAACSSCNCFSCVSQTNVHIIAIKALRMFGGNTDLWIDPPIIAFLFSVRASPNRIEMWNGCTDISAVLRNLQGSAELFFGFS